MSPYVIFLHIRTRERITGYPVAAAKKSTLDPMNYLDRNVRFWHETDMVRCPL